MVPLKTLLQIVILVALFLAHSLSAVDQMNGAGGIEHEHYEYAKINLTAAIEHVQYPNEKRLLKKALLQLNYASGVEVKEALNKLDR